MIALFFRPSKTAVHMYEYISFLNLEFDANHTAQVHTIATFTLLLFLQHGFHHAAHDTYSLQVQLH